MKITNIKKQEKLKDRYSIYVDGKYSFSLSEWQFNKHKFLVNQSISREDVDSLVKESQFGKLYELTIKWLALRPRSEFEINDYLKKKSDNASLRRDIREKLKEINQIDDLGFARAWVASRRSLKKASILRLKQELRQKKVDNDIISLVVEEDETTDTQTLESVVEKKRKQTRYQDDQKLMAYLARQGFRYEDIKKALKKH